MEAAERKRDRLIERGEDGDRQKGTGKKKRSRVRDRLKQSGDRAGDRVAGCASRDAGSDKVGLGDGLLAGEEAREIFHRAGGLALHAFVGA